MGTYGGSQIPRLSGQTVDNPLFVFEGRERDLDRGLTAAGCPGGPVGEDEDATDAVLTTTAE